MSIPSQSPHTPHTTGVGDAGRWSTRRIALLAMLTALTMAASFVEFPLIPGIPWLKYDPSGVVCLTAGFALGPSAAVVTGVLGFLPHLFVDPWGTLMAVLVALALSVPAAIVHRAHPSRRGAMAGLLAGGVCALAAAIGGNLIVTPLYAHMTLAQVAALVVPALLPFNIAKIVVHAVVTMLVYRPALALIGGPRA